MAIHQDLTSMSHADLVALATKLQADKDRAAKRRLSIKVTEKGGVAVYGLGKYPVTLYKSQWDALLGIADDIRSFIADNAHSLATKD